MVRFGLIVLIILGFAGYVLWQSRLLLGGPTLELLKEPPYQNTTPTVTVEGIARNIVEITINDLPILTDEQGYFTQDVVLTPGYTIVSIEAKDRYGRTARLERPFLYTPDNTTNLNTTTYGNKKDSKENNQSSSTEN